MLSPRPSRRPVVVVVAALAVAVALAGLPAVGLGPSRAGASPSPTPVDFGVVGETAIEAWVGESLPTVSPPDPNALVHLYLGLVSDRAALDARVLAVADPRSPDYGRGGTVVSEGAALNASPATIAAVVAWFADRGVTMTVDPTGSYVQGGVPVSVAEEAFGVAYAAFAVPLGASAAWAEVAGAAGVATSADSSPADDVFGCSLDVETAGCTPELWSPATAPTALADGLDGLVDRVYGAVYLALGSGAGAVPAGLADLPGARRATIDPAAGLTPGGGGNPNRTGTPEGCPEALAQEYGLAPNQLREAYGLDELWAAGFRGQGARVAVVNPTDYLTSDMEAFWACFGITDPTPITRHVAGNVVLNPDEPEPTLDLQVLSSMAPELDRLDWFGTYSTDNPLQLARIYFDMLVAPLDPTATGGAAPDVVSVSYAVCEAYLESNDPGFGPMRDLLDQVLATAAAAGTTYAVASGDTGSSGCWRTPAGPSPTDEAVAWPSTNRWVLAVGGTNIDLDVENEVVSSGVWNDRAFGVTSGEIDAGGGGTSIYEPRPVWQDTGDLPSGSTRLVPDLAMFADAAPGYLIHFDGSWLPIGGTSASTPLTAAALAVMTGALRAAGQPDLGFSVPLLYELARLGPAAGSPFRDVTIGSNDAYEVGVFPALTGYDQASGWGWFDVPALASALAPPSAPAEGAGLLAVPGPSALSLTWIARPVLAAGEVVEYAWDLDGDGVVDRVTTTDRIDVTYAGAGAATATVIVRTSLGRRATFTTTALVGRGSSDGNGPVFTA